MMTVHQASECAFEVDSTWVDQTRYVYVSGSVRLVFESFGDAADARERVDGALEAFERSMPRHVVLERRPLVTPIRGELIAHRMPSDGGLFEMLVYWAIDERCWLCRACGPLDAEDACRRAVERFLETYEPVEEP